MTGEPRTDWAPTALVASRLVSFAVICAVLYWGQAVLIPVALGALIAFLLSPLVKWLRHIGLPRIVAVLLVTSLVGAMLASLGYVFAREFSGLADDLPSYQTNIRAKLSDLRAMTRGGTIERVQETIENLSRDIESDVEAENGQSGAADDEEAEPVPVEIAQRNSLLEGAEMLGPALQAVATGGLALLLAIFMLARQEDLRNRLVSLAGQTSIVATTRALGEAGQRIGRYLLMQFVINASMGLAVWLGLYLIGVPYSALWGLCAAALRYIPYVGPWVAALLPITVSLVTSPGWTEVVLVVGLFVALELISNNVAEPLLYGHSTGISAIAVIVSAVFWTWLWGPVGLIMATPMTSSVIVLSRYVRGLEFLDRLLGDRPPLQPRLELYQLLLDGKTDGARELVDRYCKEHSLLETCDELLLGVVLVLKRDMAEENIEVEEADRVVERMLELIEYLSRDDERNEPDAADGAPALIIGFPSFDRLDIVALEILGASMAGAHATLDVLSHGQLIGERIAAIAAASPTAVCVVSLAPSDIGGSYHVCKRLRDRLPDVTIIVGRLGGRQQSARATELLHEAGAQQVARSLPELHDALLRDVRVARPWPRARRSA